MTEPRVHAVLLAAGVSRRLRGVVDDRPKCLLEFGGATLLSRHLAALAHHGVTRITIVTGYRSDQVEAAAGNAAGLEIRTVRTVRNDRFEEGSILSLRCGLDVVADGEAVLAMDADVLYEPDILGRLLEAGEGFLLDETSEETGEEMMLGARDGRVRRIARSPGEGFDEVGEGVGFFLCPADRVAALRRVLEETLATGGPDQEYEAALDAHLAEHPAAYRLVGDRIWTEIDYAEDIRRAERDVLPAVIRRERLLGLTPGGDG